MALDFSKFTLAAPDVSGIAKIPEYAALGDKSAKGGTGLKQIQSIYGHITPIKDAEGFVTGKMQDYVNNQINDGLAASTQYLNDGYDITTVLNDARNKVAKINQITSGLSNMGTGFTQGIENTYGKIPGYNAMNARKNFQHFITHAKDNNGNIVETDINPDILSGNVQQNLGTVLNPMIYDDNWDQGGFADVFKKSKGNTVTQNVRVRQPNGSETITDVTTDVPLNIFDVVDDGKGNKSFEVKKENYVPADLGAIKKDDLSNIYHSTLGDNMTGAVPLVPEKIYNDFMNVDGIKFYVQQEQAKFEKNLINQGVQTRDPRTGQLIPEIEAEINKFGRAAMHDAFDNNAAIIGGTKTKTATAKLAPLPQKPINITNIIKQQEKKLDEGAFHRTWSADYKANKAVDLKGTFGTFKDENGIEFYNRPKIDMAKEGGVWKVRLWKKNRTTGNLEVDKSYNLDQFRTLSPSGATEENRAQLHTALENWAKAIDLNADY